MIQNKSHSKGHSALHTVRKRPSYAAGFFFSRSKMFSNSDLWASPAAAYINCTAFARHGQLHTESAGFAESFTLWEYSGSLTRQQLLPVFSFLARRRKSATWILSPHLTTHKQAIDLFANASANIDRVAVHHNSLSVPMDT